MDKNTIFIATKKNTVGKPCVNTLRHNYCFRILEASKTNRNDYHRHT